jgi:malonate-semialdehyde dehydrogenase (acetylating)/methylmalonate-semialdehyde dehydrogenase
MGVFAKEYIQSSMKYDVERNFIKKRKLFLVKKKSDAFIKMASKERIEKYNTETKEQRANILLDGRIGKLFGPVISIMQTKKVDEALPIGNANPYRNAAGVFTQNGGTAAKSTKGQVTE